MGLHSDHQTVNYNRQIPVRKEPDVFIAGGGPAGVAAAVAAARAGWRVFLVEPFPALGGAAVNMLVPGFMTFGDGVLSFFAGAESEYGDEEGRVMAATLCGVWSGVTEGSADMHDKPVSWKSFAPAATSRQREAIKWSVSYAYNATDASLPRVPGNYTFTISLGRGMIKQEIKKVRIRCGPSSGRRLIADIL